MLSISVYISSFSLRTSSSQFLFVYVYTENGDQKCVVTGTVQPYLSLINVETKQIDLIEVEAIVIASCGCKVGGWLSA